MSSADESKRRINEERVSVDALKHVLCTRCGCKDVHIDPVEHDPPDFTVTIDGVVFPTEVTSIVSLQDYRAQCRELAKAIHDRAVSLGVLSGKYAVIVLRLPRIPKPSSSAGRQVLDAAVTHIEATQQQQASSETTLTTDRSGKISIKKVSPNGFLVGVTWVPPGMRGNEIRNQLGTLIQQAVDDKKWKLQDAGIGPRSALLVLYDAFAYGEPEDALTAMQHVSGHDWFHSIFWAASFSDRENTTYPDEPGRSGIFLFSNNPDWNKVST
jgi:hypothetical protein